MFGTISYQRGYSMEYVDKKTGPSVAVPVPGISTSAFSQIIPTKLFEKGNVIDYWAGEFPLIFF